MTRAKAAEYMSLSVAAFEREVAAGRFPPPISLGKQERWCRAQLDKALLVLAGEVIDGEDIVVGEPRKVA
jgi:hypothetical protein